MKYRYDGDDGDAQPSLPVWGAWIEIPLITEVGAKYKSLPVWGAWIEMCSGACTCSGTIASLPVWGAWIEIVRDIVLSHVLGVAPRVGSVD